MSNEQIEQVEKIVQTFINNDMEVFFKNTPLHVAKQISGLRAVFGEVYPDPVRVLSVGYSVDSLIADPSNEKWVSTSIEFCGGTYGPPFASPFSLYFICSFHFSFSFSSEIVTLPGRLTSAPSW